MKARMKVCVDLSKDRASVAVVMQSAKGYATLVWCEAEGVPARDVIAHMNEIVEIAKREDARQTERLLAIAETELAKHDQGGEVAR